MNNAFCTCSSALSFFFGQVVYENILSFNFSRINIILINEEMTKYIAGIFIQYKIIDYNSNISKI